MRTGLDRIVHWLLHPHGRRPRVLLSLTPPHGARPQGELLAAGYEVLSTVDARMIRSALTSEPRVDLWICERSLPGLDPVALLAKLPRHAAPCALFIAGFEEPRGTLDADASGAYVLWRPEPSAITLAARALVPAAA